MSRFRWTPLAAATLALLGFAMQPALAAEPEVGAPAPAFELTDLGGKTHQLADFKGKIVVLHFQSKNCPWDIAYQPQLNALAEKYAKAEVDGETVEVQFLGINANRDESVEAVKAYAKDAGISYPVLKDAGNKVADQYAARTTPHIYIIDADGTLRYKGGVEKAPVSPNQVSQQDEQYLEPVLQALIHGSEPPVTETASKGCGIKRVKAS